MNDPLRVAVVGATGYAGYELARLLLRHPKVDKPTFYLRDGHADVHCLTELYPQLRGWGEAPCNPFIGGRDREERRGCRVSFDAARSFARAGAGAARGESVAADRGFERRVPFSGARDILALVQAGRPEGGS